MAYYAAVNGIYGTLPFIFIFQFGFLYAAMISLFQGFGLDIVAGAGSVATAPSLARVATSRRLPACGPGRR